MLAQHSDASVQQVAPVLFFICAALTVISAWAVVLSQNIVRTAVYLLLTLAGVAGLYFLMQAELLAAVQLIVYVGGTLILIVFGVMLTSRNPFAQWKISPWELGLGALVGFLTTVLLIWAILASPRLPIAAQTGYATVRQVGIGLLSRYLAPFEVAGVLLLVVMVGAAYLARRTTKADKAPAGRA